MKLNDIELREPSDIEQKLKLINRLPDKRIYDLASILVVKHKDNFYITKMRGGYEYKVRTEEFDYYKKSDINYEQLNEFCKKITGGFIIIDITGWKLD
jgi:hypothetical protein